MPKTTPGPWQTEAVSDCVRVTVGTGRQKVILARLAPKQLPEMETRANAVLMGAAPAQELTLELLVLGLAQFDPSTQEFRFNGMRYSTGPHRDWNRLISAIGWDRARAAIAKAENKS